MTGASITQLDPQKFRDPLLTARGEKRVRVALRSLDTLWSTVLEAARVVTVEVRLRLGQHQGRALVDDLCGTIPNHA